MTSPSDIANLALDSIGAQNIGDLQEGSTEAQAALRIYSLCRQSLLRAAGWNFARRQSALTLLNDSTGQTAGVGTGTVGMQPWLYEYEWPTDGLRARWVPVQMYPSPTVSPPIMTGLAATPYARQMPARFLITNDTVPPFTGVPASWAAYPQPLPGRGRASQTVVLTNQPQATLVYTADVVEPDIWDPSFRLAMTAVMGSYLAMPLIKDKKMAMAVRAQQIAAAKSTLDKARVSDGDEGFTTTDMAVDWMQIRNNGGWRGGWGWNDGGGPGYFWMGWGACSLGDGSSY